MWKNGNLDFVDIQTSHVCFDPNHPGGFIKSGSNHAGWS